MSLAQGFTSAVEARIQDQVALFLSQKSTLVRLQGASNPIVQEQADKLYSQQLTLEEELKKTLKRIDNIKAGAYTISDVTAIGTFGKIMSDHIKQVQQLQAGSPLEASVITANIPLLLAGATIVGGFLYTMKNRSQDKRSSHGRGKKQ